MTERDRHESHWSIGYPHFLKVINRRKLKVGVEIGVAFGGHSYHIMKNSKVKRLYGVDRYMHMPGYDDPMNYPQYFFDIIYKNTIKRMEKFNNKFVLLRMESDLAYMRISESVDFVYIDADHSFSGCYNDISTWIKKVKQGGVIGGHDYNSESFPGVTLAVNGIAHILGLKIHSEGNGCWWTTVRTERKILLKLLPILKPFVNHGIINEK